MIQNSSQNVELTVQSHYNDSCLSREKQILNESEQDDNFQIINVPVKVNESLWNDCQNLLTKTPVSNCCNDQSNNQPPVPKPRKKWSEKSQVSKSNFIVDSIHTSKGKISNFAKSTDEVEKITTKNQLVNDISKSCYSGSSTELLDNEINCIFRKEDTDVQNNNVFVNTKEMEDQEVHLTESEIESGNIISVDLKKVQGSLGLNIEPKDMLVPGLLSVCSLVPNGSAEIDGRIEPGDQLLEVNGVQLDKVPYYEAVNLLRTSSEVTNIIVEKKQTSRKDNENSKPDFHISDICDELDDIYNDNMKKWQVVHSKKEKLSNPICHSTSPCIADLHSTKENELGKISYHNIRPLRKADTFDGIATVAAFMPSLNCDKTCVEDDQVSCDTSSGISTGSSSLFPCVPEEKQSRTLPVSVDKNETIDTKENKQYFNMENDSSDTIVNSSLIGENQNISNSTRDIVQSGGYSLNASAPLNLTLAPKVPQRRFRQLKKVEDIYKFITKENTFDILIRKSSRGLGLSICGGYDMGSKGCINQLIRIRKLYPLQPAMECGKLKVGDVIIEVNGKSTLKLTHTEALDALRAAPTNVTLKIHRPDPTIIPSLPLNMRDDSCPSFSFESPSSSVNNTLRKSSSVNNHSNKEFEIIIEKQEGSLGFTVLKREQCDSTFPGLFVKDLIREPAKSDGRIEPGDQILQVNDTDMSELSHAEAINFLRSAPNEVKIKLFRNAEPPLSPLSGEDDPPLSKPLRREAVELLSDWARQKDSPGRKRERRRVRTKTDDSFSSSGSRSNSSSLSQDNTFLVSDSDNNLLSEEELSNSSPGLERSLRPKSLDILNSFTRKQRLANLNCIENGQSLLRQTSVKVTNLEAELSMFPSEQEKGNAKKNLLKWRGTTLPKHDKESENETSLEVLSEDVLTETIGKKPAEKIFEKIEHIEIQLDRGWHGRLGFSICDADNHKENILPDGPEVKVVHKGSLAAQDGRIRAGDILIQVNEESVSQKSAAEVIDILRKTRGLVRLTLARLREEEEDS